MDFLASATDARFAILIEHTPFERWSLYQPGKEGESLRERDMRVVRWLEEIIPDGSRIIAGIEFPRRKPTNRSVGL
jgi:hypothetical protein